jgi:hypothetical protein
MVNNLTRECNEFQQYCVRKGVPRQELMPLNQANSMEEVVLWVNLQFSFFNLYSICLFSVPHIKIVNAVWKGPMSVRHYSQGIPSYWNWYNQLNKLYETIQSKHACLPSSIRIKLPPIYLWDAKLGIFKIIEK